MVSCTCFLVDLTSSVFFAAVLLPARLLLQAPFGGDPAPEHDALLLPLLVPALPWGEEDTFLRLEPERETAN